MNTTVTITRFGDRLNDRALMVVVLTLTIEFTGFHGAQPGENPVK